MRIAVIGAGAMGRWFVNFARQNLGEVVVVDVDVKKAKSAAQELGVRAAKSVEGAVAKADIAIVAVPIAKTPEVVRSLSQLMRENSLLMDIASVKSDVVGVMTELRAGPELVSIHPLFGPGAKDVKGKDFLVVPVRPGEIYAKFKQRLLELGARVTEVEAEEHDRLMAVSQSLTHFVLLSYLSTLNSMKDSRRASSLRPPMFDALLDVALALLAGNPDMYGEIQVFNKYSQLARSVLMEACNSLNIAFAAGDVKAVRKIFSDAMELWGKGEAQEAYRRLYEHFEVKR
ncbi:MAG: prephenate dehydrogenase/arogenate dehydrogenase family protein [Hadesarchaea archaeon]|nr:prephenate dehydrogenase/arogenate dehydrogenase family protein [Hadesarchaea archaeon]